MMSKAKAAVILAILAMLISSVLCASILSQQGDTNPDTVSNKVLRSLLDDRYLHTSTSSRAVLLILRQKCHEWQQRGLLLLPSYCYTTQGNSNIARALLA